MACSKCGAGWKFIDGILQCSCGVIAPYQPMPSHKEALEKYEELLRKHRKLVRQCEKLADGETSLNSFKIMISNLG